MSLNALHSPVSGFPLAPLPGGALDIVDLLLAGHSWANAKGQERTSYDHGLRLELKRSAAQYRRYIERMEKRRVDWEVSETHDILRIACDQVGAQFDYVEVPRLPGDLITGAKDSDEEQRARQRVDIAIHSQDTDRSWTVGGNDKKKRFFS